MRIRRPTLVRTILAAVAVPLALGSCGAGADPPGLYLQLSGAGAANRFDLLFASPPVLIAQRSDDQFPIAEPHDVPYFVATATTKTISLDSPAAIDGYTILVEPGQPALASFVPIVIAEDGDGVPVAVGVVPGGSDGTPVGLAFVDGEAEVAGVPMVPVRDATDTVPMAGDLQGFTCGSDQSDRGFRWFDGDGRELRLVADVPADPYDLDCDGYGAKAGDCDDVRDDVNPGARAVCDGTDYTCSAHGASAILATDCDDSCLPGSGARQLCEEPGDQASCSLCRRPEAVCSVQLAGADASLADAALCSPSVGPLSLPPECVLGCTVTVLRGLPGVTATIRNTQDTNTFGSAATFGAGDIDKAELQLVTNDAAPVAPGPFGELDFMVETAGSGAGRQYFGVELDGSNTACASQSHDGDADLDCPAIMSPN